MRTRSIPFANGCSETLQRRDEAAMRRKGKPHPHLRYRRREVRLAYAIAIVLVGLLLAAWASF